MINTFYERSLLVKKKNIYLNSTMKNLHILIGGIVLGFFIAATNSQTKACRDKVTWSKNDWACDNPHTMCLYESEDPAADCGTPQQVGLRSEEQQEILNRHNELRAKVASGVEKRGTRGTQPAGVLPPLVWDELLAKIAQKWANQCIWDHDECRNIDPYQVGQNIAYQYSGSLSDMIDRWYDEVDNFDCHNVPKLNWQNNTAHYTQIVWGETTSIGCGYIVYLNDTVPFFHRHYLVCNYGPSGNFPGDPVYNTTNGGC